MMGLMQLQLGHPGDLSARAWIGRPSIGKTLPHGAGLSTCLAVLHRVVSEIGSREAAQHERWFSWLRRRPGATYYLITDEDRLLAEHPGNDELRALVAAVRERGPAVGVVLKHKP
jgi:hypothetical protein